MADIYDHLKELVKIEIVYKNTNTINHYKSYIKCLDDDRMLIDSPSYRGKSYDIEDNQQILLSLYAEDGVYTGECKVLGKELSKISGLWISYPYNSKHSQRREYLRVNLNVPIDLTIFKDSLRTESTEYRIISKDISGNGFCYICDELLTDYYDMDPG